MPVVRVHGVVVTDEVEGVFSLRVQEVEQEQGGVRVGDVVLVRVADDLVTYWIGDADIEPGTVIDAAITVPLVEGERVDVLDLQLNNGELERFL